MRRRPPFALFALLFPTIVGGSLLTWATGRGLGIEGDSVAYLSAAESLAAGRGLRWYNYYGDFEPLHHFPPGYPAVLSVGEWFGDVRPWSRWVNVVCFSGVCGLTAWLGRRATRGATGVRDIAGLLAGLLVATTLPLLAVAARVYSEGLYLLTALAGLALLAIGLGQTTSDGMASDEMTPDGRPGRRRLAYAAVVAAGLLWGLAILVRYAGLYLPPVGVLTCVVFGMTWHLGWRHRVTSAVLLGASAALPVGVWMLRNRGIDAPASGRHYNYAPPSWDELGLGLRTLRDWLMPRVWPGDDRMTGDWVMLGLLIAFVTLPPIVWGRTRPRGHDRGPDAATITRGLLWLAVVAYLPFVWVARAWADGAIAFGARTLCVIFPPATAWLVAWAFDAARGVTRPFDRVANGPSARFAGVTAMLIVTLGAVANRDAFAWAGQARSAGLGYASARWIESPTLAAVDALPPDARIWTNAPDVLYARLARTSVYLPRKYYRDSQKVNRELRQHLRELVAQTQTATDDAPAVLVLFARHRINRAEWLSGYEDLVGLVELHPIHVGGDGGVWQFGHRLRRPQ